MTTMVAQPHKPVLVDRVVALFSSAVDGTVIDATVGAGGHATAIARDRRARFGHADIIGIDQDPVAVDLAERAFAQLAGVEAQPWRGVSSTGHAHTASDAAVSFAGSDIEGNGYRVTLVRARFDELRSVIEACQRERVAGVLFDLGLSSMQLDAPVRGFSYRYEAPLDMRMDPDRATSAAALVNDTHEHELARIIRTYGEERFADRIARAIAQQRPVTTTTQLADIVKSAIPAAARRTGGHPATRTFQALRIAVNQELDVLDDLLPQAIDAVDVGGVVAALSYHSLEDRRVKHAFSGAAQGCICPPTMPVCGCGRVPIVEELIHKVVQPSDDEISDNPRARSARLRAVRRVSRQSDEGNR